MKRWVYFLVFVLLLGGIIAWRIQQKKTLTEQSAAARQKRINTPPLISVVPAGINTIDEIFIGVGSVESPQNVKLASKVVGRIDSVLVREGDAVRKGQVLVHIDPTEVEADVNRSRAALAEAKARLAQAALTQNPALVSVSTQIRQQQAALDTARADYNQVKENYNSQVATAESVVTDAKGKLNVAEAVIANAKAGIQRAQANVDNANSRLKRVSDLYKRGFIAAQDVDDAGTVLKVQQASLEVARGQLSSASAQRDSVRAQLESAGHQVSIVKTSGKANIEAAQAKVTQAQAALEYARSNRAQTPAYQQNLAALRSVVDAAKATLSSSLSRMQDTELKSPIDGFVTGRNMDTGTTVSGGQVILTVQELKQLWVAFPAPEEVSRKLRMGMLAGVQLDALPGKRVMGKIVTINASADPQSRQFSVRVSLVNPGNIIKPGMFARVQIITQHVPGAITVPLEAVQSDKNGNPSLVVYSADNTVLHRTVKTGASDTRQIQILEGIKPGEKVVIMSAAPLKDGQTVRLASKKPADDKKKRSGN